MQQYSQFYIDGQWVDPIESNPFELVNPTTEEVFATVALGSPADVDRAVVAARKAFESFSRTLVNERIELLHTIAAGLEKRGADVHAALTQEMGAPASLKAQIGSSINALKQAAKSAASYEFESRRDRFILRHEAIGVAGLITPWNWPIQLLCNKLASAFAAGCSVVLKPSEYTPVSAIVFTEMLHELGLPAGLFNLVNGDGPGVGNAISSHKGIDVVSFTGSTRAGILVAEAAAASVKRVTQELGGKSANIVLPDADLKAAAEFNVTRGFSNSGQSCHSPTRVLVHESQLEEMEGYLAEAVAQHTAVGDPTDPAITHGPVVNRNQFQMIQRYIQSAIDEGAKLIAGGPGRPEGIDKGFFVQPTVFSQVTPDMTIAREEIFGMVTAVIPYKTVAEAMQIANDTPYGLAAYVFTADDHKAYEIACEMRAGRVFINGAPPSTDVPMGGYKMSGNGREMGEAGMEEYLEVKAILCPSA